MESPEHQPDDDFKANMNQWVIEAIAPALIMILVGSLVFFLIEVFYEDVYNARLCYIFGLFVFAAVLVGRISIEEGRAYASLFAIPLGLATWFVANVFVQVDGPLKFLSPLLVAGFILVVWFWADRLTWDCTVVDFSKDVSNQGLLKTVADQAQGISDDEAGATDGANATQGTSSTPAPTLPSTDPRNLVSTGNQGPEAPLASARPFQTGPKKKFGHSSDSESIRESYGLDPKGNPTLPAESYESQLYGTSSRESADMDKWWARFSFGKRKQNAPGVWVIYLTLAAIPIFGIGQAFIPTADVEIRRWAFMLFLAYTFAGLGLLLTTSLLSLQRYLRKRNLTLPNPIAVNWIAIGGTAIVAVLIVVWLLPRPAPEFSIFPSKPFSLSTNDKVKPSDYGWGDESEHESSSGSQQSDSQSQSSSDQSGGGQSGGQSQGNSSQGQSSRQNGGNQGSSGGNSGNSNSRQNQNDSNQNSSSQNQQNNSSQNDNRTNSNSSSNNQQNGNSSNNRQGDQSQNNNRQGDGSSGDQSSDSQNSNSDNSQSSNSNSNRNNGQGSRSQDNEGSRQNNSDQNGSRGSQSNGQNQNNYASAPNPGETGRSNRTNQENQNQANSSSRNSSQSSSVTQLGAQGLGTIGTIIKFFMIALLICVAVFVGWRNRAQLRESFAKFIEELRRLLARLFGWKLPKKKSPEEELALVPQERPKPFTDFLDPFETGTYESWSPKQLVGYSFQAFEAWGRDRNCPREVDQTPREFASQIAHVDKQVAQAASQMADVYAQVAYAPEQQSAISHDILRQFWQVLRQRYIQPQPPTPLEAS